MRTGGITNQVRDKRLSTVERLSLSDAIADEMERGTHSINGLAERLNKSRTTIRRYKSFAEKRFQTGRLNRVAIRNLEIQRANRLRERLISELDSCKTTKERATIYNTIIRYSQHIAVISGIGGTDAKVTQFNDVKQLVITRANPAEVEMIKQQALEAGFKQ